MDAGSTRPSLEFKALATKWLSNIAHGKFYVLRFRDLRIAAHWTMAPFVVAAIGAGFEASLWIGCLFVGVLIHELGHVAIGSLLGGRRFEIVLSPLGGTNHLDVSRGWKYDLFVVISGPMANMAFSFILEVSQRCVLFQQPPWGLWVNNLSFCSLSIGILNILPMWPLDGGRVVDLLLSIRLSRPHAKLWVGILSLTLAVVGAIALGSRSISLLIGFAIIIGVNVKTIIKPLRWIAAESRWGTSLSARCPFCRTPAFAGQTDICDGCSMQYNALDGKCWHCQAVKDIVFCSYCDRQSKLAEWFMSGGKDWPLGSKRLGLPPFLVPPSMRE